MSKKRQNYMKKSDALFSKIVRDRDGGCVAAGTDPITCKGVNQCAHLITRSYKSIRCDFDNAVTLCQAHHTYYTHHPLEWEDWVDLHYPGRIPRLRDVALRYERVNWKAKHEELSAMAKTLELV